MKKTISSLALATVLLLACNNNSKQSESTQPASSSGSEMHATTDEANIAKVSPAYKDLSPEATAFVKSVADHYLNLEAALVKDDSKSAAAAADAIQKDLKSFDKSHFTIEQKKEYDQAESGLKSSSESIASSGLDDQRKQFVTMSNSMYLLAKNFSTGQTLYHQFCPMYEGGSYWLSSMKDIKNPFYGNKMLTCGSVKEIIQ